MLGCELCELEPDSLAMPFSGSKRRERGDNLYRIDRPRVNTCPVGESGEKRERSKEGLGGGTAIDRCSLNLDEGSEGVKP
jgi:hypothetical protein